MLHLHASPSIGQSRFMPRSRRGQAKGVRTSRGTATTKTNLNSVFRAVYSFVQWLLLPVCLMGCATCKNDTVDSVRNNDKQWTADLYYRVCGYVSGFSVSIYLTRSGPHKDGEGSKEPFKASISAQAPYVYKQSPISIKWIGDRNLVIRHDTRMSIEDADAKLKITKASGEYEGIAISYEPIPVVWE